MIEHLLLLCHLDLCVKYLVNRNVNFDIIIVIFISIINLLFFFNLMGSSVNVQSEKEWNKIVH